MRPVVPLSICVREAPRAEPPRAPPRRQAVHLRRVRHAVPVPQVVQEAPAEPHARTASHEERGAGRGPRPGDEYERGGDRSRRRDGPLDEAAAARGGDPHATHRPRPRQHGGLERAERVDGDRGSRGVAYLGVSVGCRERASRRGHSGASTGARASRPTRLLCKRQFDGGQLGDGVAPGQRQGGADRRPRLATRVPAERRSRARPRTSIRLPVLRQMRALEGESEAARA